MAAALLALLLHVLDAMEAAGAAYERLVNRAVVALGFEPIIPTTEGDPKT